MTKHLLVVCYDVSTESPAGRKRLRQIAKACESVGQRVQKSVFECRLDASQLFVFEEKLRKLMDEGEDNLRIYRIAMGNAVSVKEFGTFRATDFDGPLVL